MSQLSFHASELPSRTEYVLNVIKERILNGDFVAGHPLVESDLAADFGMSKTPVREALKSLHSSGLVIMRPYTGTFVRTIEWADAVSIYEMRLLLEPEAVRRSVAQGIDVLRAEEALDNARSATTSSARSLANRQFHRVMYSRCSNPLLIRTLEGFSDQAALVAATAWGAKATWQDEADEHEALLGAAKKLDAPKASQLIQHHISTFIERLVRNSEGA